MNIKIIGLLLLVIVGLTSCNDDVENEPIKQEQYTIETDVKGHIVDAVIASDSCSLWVLNKLDTVSNIKNVVINNKRFTIK